MTWYLGRRKLNERVACVFARDCRRRVVLVENDYIGCMAFDWKVCGGSDNNTTLTASSTLALYSGVVIYFISSSFVAARGVTKDRQGGTADHRIFRNN